MSDVIIMISSIVWFIFGFIGDHIRQCYLIRESSNFIDVLLGPITLIIDGIEALLIKCQEHKLHKTRKEAQKPVDEYEKRAIERINKLLEINN